MYKYKYVLYMYNGPTANVKRTVSTYSPKEEFSIFCHAGSLVPPTSYAHQLLVSLLNRRVKFNRQGGTAAPRVDNGRSRGGNSLVHTPHQTVVGKCWNFLLRSNENRCSRRGCGCGCGSVQTCTTSGGDLMAGPCISAVNDVM